MRSNLCFNVIGSHTHIDILWMMHHVKEVAYATGFKILLNLANIQDIVGTHSDTNTHVDVEVLTHQFLITIQVLFYGAPGFTIAYIIKVRTNAIYADVQCNMFELG